MLEIKVNVQVGVTPEVAAIATAILNRQPAAVEAPKSAAASATDPEPEAPAPARRGRPKKEQPAAEQPQPAAEQPQAAAPETPAEPAAPAADPAPADTGDMPDNVFYPSEEDVRTAMHKSRERIEGADYKDKPSDDLHRAVTDVFKAIANELSGQKKPSALPQELRQAFIDATRTIQQDVDGKFIYTLNK